ncbi:MAG: AI-2E family transporter [Pirellulaceae bacterium]|nr:AI-2E family transporter [Pirellulaceae bacterium]
MSRKVSFVVLLAILFVIAGVFIRVMANFLLPLFLAVLLVVMFRPLHRWFVAHTRGHDRVAAGLTTLAILLIFLVPLLLVFFEAAREGVALARQLDLSAVQPWSLADIAQAVEKFNARSGLNLPADAIRDLPIRDIQSEITTRAQQWLAPLVFGTTRYAASFVVGLCIMVVALYYFLADGPRMVSTVMRLSPLDEQYETELLQEFDTVARAVVLASVVSALAQGALAGIGYYMAGLEYVFMLTILTMLLAMVPFVGATVIWIPCCLWLYFYEQRTLAAVVLAVYCTLVVSMIDNVIKPMVLQGRSNLHPLLALLSILGGAQVLGPIGIFVGPMAVTFLYAVLVMVQKEIDAMQNAAQTDKP